MKSVYAVSITKEGVTIEFEIGSYDDAVQFMGFCLDALVGFDSGEIGIKVAKRKTEYK